MDALHRQGETIGDRYQIVTFLGQGGTGTTYAAVDRETHQRVAIKAVSLRRVQDWKVVELFEREAKVLAALQHPAIPKYLDYFHCDTESDRYFYLVQELVEGESLATLVNRGWKVQEQQVKYIATQILEILKYLHSFRPPIIHRDIKPQNIIIRPDRKVYLVDFGAVQEVYRNTLSLGGTFMGTMGYISPEQFRGKVIPASDLYSLGCTLLFVLTRRSPTDLPQKRMRFDFRDRFSLSPEFADWLEKMVEPAKEDRFSSAEEALQILNRKDTLSSSTKNLALTKYRSHRIRVPRNTKSILQRGNLLFSVRIPPKEKPPNINLSSLMNNEYIPWMITIIVILLVLFSVVFKIYFPILVGVIFVLVVRSILQDIWQEFKLEIKPKSFKIEWSWLGLNSIQTGKTQNITFIDLGINKDKSGDKFCCLIWDGMQRYSFGRGLEKVEVMWLVEEIVDFLEGLKEQNY